MNDERAVDDHGDRRQVDEKIGEIVPEAEPIRMFGGSPISVAVPGRCWLRGPSVRIRHRREPQGAAR